MLAVDWEHLTIAGAFIVGTGAGALVTVKLAKVLAEFYAHRVGRGDDRGPDPPAPDTPAE